MTHPLIALYLDHLTASGRASTARAYGECLSRLTAWAEASGIDLVRLTPDILARFHLWLATTFRKADGEPLARSTQGTVIVVIRSWCQWLHRRGHVATNPAVRLVPPDQPAHATVRKDHLDQQEAIALLLTADARVREKQGGSVPWAIAVRNRALLAFALATGRRASGLCDLDVADLDHDRNEYRVEREKGKTGCVLPAAAWAMQQVQYYVAEGRPILLDDRPSDALFVTQHIDRMTTRALAFVLDEIMAATIAANPDLTALPSKRISPHSLRVTCAARLLFDNGCPIRSVGAVLLHASLETTQRYVPGSVEDLRRALIVFHPRA